MMNTGDNDFKYILQEFSRTMIGARYSYGELLGAERLPFKFQTIIDRLILPYADSDMTLEEHLKSLTKEDKNFRIFENLKLKVKYYLPGENGGYKEHTEDVKSFVESQKGLSEGIVISEIILSNLALMGFKL